MHILLIAIATVGVTYLVVRDANARAMSGAGWGFFVAFTTVAGLPIYLLARRKHPKT